MVRVLVRLQTCRSREVLREQPVDRARDVIRRVGINRAASCPTTVNRTKVSNFVFELFTCLGRQIFVSNAHEAVACATSGSTGGRYAV